MSDKTVQTCQSRRRAHWQGSCVQNTTDVEPQTAADASDDERLCNDDSLVPVGS